MTARRRQGILLAALTAGLLGAALWARGRCTAAGADAARAREDLAACRRIAVGIEQLRSRPNLAGAEELQLTILAKRAEQAAKAAGFAPDRIARIWPEPDRRVGETVYKEKPTQIVLKDISMKHLVVFLHSLTSTTPGLSARSLRLSASRGREAQDDWSAEVVVSYLIYAPPKSAGGAAEDGGF